MAKVWCHDQTPRFLEEKTLGTGSSGLATHLIGPKTDGKCQLLHGAKLKLEITPFWPGCWWIVSVPVSWSPGAEDTAHWGFGRALKQQVLLKERTSITGTGQDQLSTGTLHGNESNSKKGPLRTSGIKSLGQSQFWDLVDKSGLTGGPGERDALEFLLIKAGGHLSY